MDSKTLTFMVIMSTLGNALFVVSYYAVKFAPGVALDFSLIPAFIAGVYGGPWLGLLTGVFAGILPGVFFGPLGDGSWLGLISLPIGKALTGFTSGLLTKVVGLWNKQHSSLLAVPLVLISYIPECLFTIAYFVFLMPYFLGKSGLFWVWFVLAKAWGEIIVMSFLMGALVGNYGFTSFVGKYLSFKHSFIRKAEQ
jgi:LytS/YehU family sensor histidine kinase